MNRLQQAWKHIPNKPRRVLTFLVGMLIIALAGAVGPIPGPGGIVLFLFGIAVLATEFTWAERLRDKILEWLKRLGAYARAHPYKSALLIFLGAGIIFGAGYIFYTKIL